MMAVSAQAGAARILEGTVTFIGDGGGLTVDVTYAVYGLGDTDSPLNPAPENAVGGHLSIRGRKLAGKGRDTRTKTHVNATSLTQGRWSYH